MAYDFSKIEEPTLLNILIDGFNELGYTTIMGLNNVFDNAKTFFVCGHRVQIRDNKVIWAHCAMCDIHDGEAFKQLMEIAKACIEGRHCSGETVKIACPIGIPNNIKVKCCLDEAD